MYFRTAASLVLLACASNVAAEPKPYRLAMMPVLGMSLSRRSTSGYQPEQTVCGSGDTCDQACGTGYTQCASHDDSVHCYNPAANQLCCTDGSGNSCDAGYYCTHDKQAQTWCCPESMDLTACAAAYSVTGGLETASSTSAAPSSSTAPSSETVTYYEPTVATTYMTPTASSGYSTAWTGSNSTTVHSTQPTASAPISIPATGTATGPAQASSTNGAAANSVSALLVVAAGFIAML